MQSLMWPPNGPRGEQPKAAELRAVAAKAVCAGCPIRTGCAEWAIYNQQAAGDPTGGRGRRASVGMIWGGTTQSERADIRTLRATPKPAPVPAIKSAQKRRTKAECGTASGYQAHRRLREATCDPCRIAYNAAVNRWRRGQRAS